MSTETPQFTLEDEYREAADAYLRGLTLRNFMEASQSGTQRKITLESLDLLSRQRSDVHVFNEMLVQYPLSGKKELGQVVPDNMVVLRDEAFGPIRSFNVPIEGVKPFWVLEYVSKGTKRKDYKDNYRQYERQLGVSYYLLFEPEKKKMRLYRLEGGRYAEVEADEKGRCAIPELELEVGLLDGWVRYWFRGELLLLPADLQTRVEAATAHAAEERRGRLAAEKRLVATQAELDQERLAREAKDVEIARLKAEIEAMGRR